MRRLLLLLFALLSVSASAGAQQPGRPRYVPTKPGGACNERDFIQALDTDIASLCQDGAWKDLATGASSVPSGIDAAKIADGSVSNAEYQFINSLTLNAQTQLDAKQPLDSDLTTIAGLTATTDNFLVSVSSAWASRTPAQAKTTLALNNVENTALSTWAGSTAITTTGTVTTGTWGGLFGAVSGANLTTLNAANISSGTLAAARGGTGVSNTGTITLAGNLVTTGAFNTTFAQVANTTITGPATSGTMATLNASNAFTGATQSITSLTPDLKLLDTTTGSLSPTFISNLSDVAVFSVNRDPATGTFAQTGKAAAQISLTGTASSGIMDFRVSSTNNTLPPVQMSIAGSGAITLNSGLTNASGTPGSLCYNTSTFEMLKNNALTCTVSSRSYKQGITPLSIQALSLVLKVQPTEFTYRDAPLRKRWGFIAEDLAQVDRRLADGYDASGNPKSIDQNALLSLAIRAIQEQQKQIDLLKAELRPLRQQARLRAWFRVPRKTAHN